MEEWRRYLIVLLNKSGSMQPYSIIPKNVRSLVTCEILIMGSLSGVLATHYF